MRKLYIEHESVDAEDGVAYFGPFTPREIGRRINDGYADFLAQVGNLEVVKLSSNQVRGMYINPPFFWTHQTKLFRYLGV